MDITRAKELVYALAEGIDPFTGEVLPSDHICNNADVVRAFYALLQKEPVKRKENSYENSGKRWTKEDDELLKQLFEQGIKINELQKRFMRTRGSIQSRLAKLGLIEEESFSVRYRH